jgi:hypothetical protein
MKEYEESVLEDRIDNTVGLQQNSYEARLLEDISSQIKNEYGNPGGYDDYGYRRDQYHQYGQLQQSEVAHSTAAQLSFFREVNDVANGFSNYCGNNGFFGLY